MNVATRILQVLQEAAEKDEGYTNPFFLAEISALLEEYYELEDDKVDFWIGDMCGR